MTVKRLEGFLDQLASATPTPAGGAATALIAATAAALVAMVSRIAAREGTAGGEAAPTAREAEALRARLTALIQEDSAAFAAVIAARRLPVEERSRAVHSALVRATEIPLEIAEAAARILALGDELAPRARPSTVSDLAVAVALAGAALDSAALTARVNMRALDDAAFVARTQGALAALAGNAAVTRHRVAQVVAARTGIPA